LRSGQVDHLPGNADRLLSIAIALSTATSLAFVSEVFANTVSLREAI